MKHLIFIIMLLPLSALAQGELYQRYASRADLTVAQVSGFRLNDTARTDVVLVVADGDEAWQNLLAELKVEEAEGVSSWLATEANPAQRTRWNGRSAVRVVVSHGRHTVGFYRVDSEGTYDALLDYQLNAMARPGGRNRH